MKYIRNLSKADDRVMSVSPQVGKETRPFVGIAAIRNYKKMAVKQLDWCQRNQDAIVKKANKLYTLLQSDRVSSILKKRCCDFNKLEIVLQKWIGGSSDKKKK